jgi:hypothetical protein
VAYEDRTLTCVDCKTAFTFSARDQEFHAQKGFTNEPKRCTNCRQARRTQRGDAPQGAVSVAAGGRAPVYSGPRAQPRPGARNDRERGGGRSGGRGGFDRGSRREGGGGDATNQRSFGGETQATAYTATCSACGKDTATSADAGNRVVFCSDCYEKMTALTRS